MLLYVDMFLGLGFVVTTNEHILKIILKILKFQNFWTLVFNMWGVEARLPPVLNMIQRLRSFDARNLIWPDFFNIHCCLQPMSAFKIVIVFFKFSDLRLGIEYQVKKSFENQSEWNNFAISKKSFWLRFPGPESIGDSEPAKSCSGIWYVCATRAKVSPTLHWVFKWIFF